VITKQRSLATNLAGFPGAVRQKNRFVVRFPGMVILFDIDGTLIDHDSAEAIAVAALRDRMGQTEDSVGFLRRWRSAFERHYNRYLAGELSIQEQRRERLREVFDPNLSDDAADRLIDSYINEYLAACELYSDVKPTLARMATYQMGIVSNGERRQQQYKLEKTGIDRYFGPLILSAECGVAKPARGIFELACDSMGAPPSQAIYVGDRCDVDAEAARSVGMHGVWLDRFGVSDDSDSPMRINSLSILPVAIRLIEQGHK
jgi:putative hydrolase of the HAD superfamily